MLVVEAYPMRTLYVRRHTMRRKPGQHLSQDGIALARLVGAESGPFSLVVTSPVPRAVETAIAMGFEVDETDESLGRIPSGTASGWPCPFSRISEVVRAGGRAAKFATEIADLWRSIVEPQAVHRGRAASGPSQAAARSTQPTGQPRRCRAVRTSTTEPPARSRHPPSKESAKARNDRRSEGEPRTERRRPSEKPITRRRPRQPGERRARRPVEAPETSRPAPAAASTAARPRH